MNWFLIALIAPFVWAISVHIDKHLIKKYFKGGGVGALIIFSSLIGVPLLPIIYIIHPTVFSISAILALLLIVNGFLYVLGILPFLYALSKDETSIVAPLFQMVPVFSYLLALVFLKETLTFLQISASMLIIFGAVGLSLDTNNKIPKLKKKIFWLMVLASFSVALNGMIFKFVAIRENFWTTSFWEYVGFSIFGLVLLLFVKSYREQFLSVLKHNSRSLLEINIINEGINIIGKIIMNFTTLLAPLALVWVINGVQPFFIIALGVFLTVFFPHLGKEKIFKKHLVQKISSVGIMFIGIFLLNL